MCLLRFWILFVVASVGLDVSLCAGGLMLVLWGMADDGCLLLL